VENVTTDVDSMATNVDSVATDRVMKEIDAAKMAFVRAELVTD
jgi:hypothetical protein